MRPFFAFRQKSLFIPGCVQGAIIWFVCVCVTVVVLTDYENCTRPIPTNPGSMEAGGYGLTRGTCFVARRHEVVSVAGLLWISWCVFGAAEYIFCVFVFSIYFFFERTRPAASIRPPYLIYLYTGNEARPRERSDRGRFLPIGKKASSYRGVYRVPFFNLSVRLSVSVRCGGFFRFFFPPIFFPSSNAHGLLQA